MELKILQVKGERGQGYLSVRLEDFLALVKERGISLTWCVLVERELTEIYYPESSNFDQYQELFAGLKDKEYIACSWTDLFDAAKKVMQIASGTFVAVRNHIVLDSMVKAFLDKDSYFIDEANSSLFNDVEFVFQVFEATFWLAYFRDRDLFELALTSFPQVEVHEVKS